MVVFKKGYAYVKFIRINKRMTKFEYKRFVHLLKKKGFSISDDPEWYDADLPSERFAGYSLTIRPKKDAINVPDSFFKQHNIGKRWDKWED